jgi:hypothetical protein
MKVIRYKIFYLYRNYSLKNSDKYTADTVIALLAMITFLYCTPLIAILLKMTGLLQMKGLSWIAFGVFAFFNFKAVEKKYRAEINDAVNYLAFSDIRKTDKYMIAFLSAFSVPYLIITVSLLKSVNFI